MSVSKFRDRMESKGCQIVVFTILGALAFSMVFSTCSPGGRGGPEITKDGAAIATVGDFPVTEGMVINMANRTLDQFREAFGGQIPPVFIAQYTGVALDQQVNAGLLIELCTRERVDLGDESVRRAVNKMIDEEIERNKQTLIAEKKVAADASPAVMDAAYKTAHQLDPKSQREATQKRVEEMLKNPAERNELLVSAANTLLMEKYSNEVPATDDAVKAFFDVYMSKRIFLKEDKHPGVDLKKKANDIMAEIKGGLTFEAAMNKYSDDEPGPGKPKSDNEFQVDGKTISLNATYAPIAKQTIGAVEGPYTLGDGGVSIVRVNSKVTQLPPDFEAKKAQYKRDFQRDRAAGKLQEKLKGLKAENLVKWKSPGYELLFDLAVYTQSDEARSATPAERKAKYEAFIKRGDEAANDPLGQRVVPLAQFWAFNQVWTDSSDAEKANLTDRRIEVLEGVLQQTESGELRTELVDLYAVKKDGVKVTENLEFAASAISANFDAPGQQKYAELQAKLLKLKEAGVINAEQEAKVRLILDQWATDKIAKDKFDEEARKQEEQARKDAEAAQKAEQDKAAAGTKPK